MKRFVVFGLAVAAVLAVSSESQAFGKRGGRCGGGGVFHGGRCGVSYGCGTPVSYGCGAPTFQCGGGQVVWQGAPASYQPTFSYPAPLPSYGTPMIIQPSGYQTPTTPLRIEPIPPEPRKGPAPLPSKEPTSQRTGPTYYLINGVYYLAAN